FDANRHSFQLDVSRVTFTPDFRDPFFTNARRRNQYLLNLLLGDDFSERSVSTKNAEAVNQLAMLVRIIVHKTDRRIAQFSIIQQLAQQQFTGIAGAIDQDALAVFFVRRRQHLSKEAKGDAAARQES